MAIVRKLNEQQPRLSLRQISAELAAAGYVPHKGKGSKRPGGKTLFNSDDETKGMRRGAVAATAATVLEFRQDCSRAELGWARRVLKRAILTPEKRDLMWTSNAVIPWHQAIFVARGLAADLREGTAESEAALALLGLVAHPLEAVSLAALKEGCRLWDKAPKLAWSALIVAFSLCRIEPRPPGHPRGPREAIHSPEEIHRALGAAIEFYRNGSGWPQLPFPPPAWVKLDTKEASAIAVRPARSTPGSQNRAGSEQRRIG